MTTSPRLTQRRAAALRAIEEQLDELRARSRVREPLARYELVRIGNALGDAGLAVSRERPPFIAFDWPGEAKMSLAEVRSLLQQARACLAPPRQGGHKRNRTLAEIPKHYGVAETYPRVRSP